MRIVENELGFSVLARHREVGFDNDRFCRIVLTEILPAQEQKITQVSRASNKHETEQRSQNHALNKGATMRHLTNKDARPLPGHSFCL